MASKTVYTCDRCGVDMGADSGAVVLTVRPVRIYAAGSLDSEGVALDICDRCASAFFRMVAPAVDPEMVGTLLRDVQKRQDERAKHGDYNPAG